jgi:hypothetical protein
VKRILSAPLPATFRLEWMRQLDLAGNLTTTNALSLINPPPFFARAGEVIE